MSVAKIVFLRHAHRNTDVRQRDNGIDEKGMTQVEELLEQYQAGILPKGDYFLSSPKKRCIETVEKLASLAKQKLEIEMGLNEQNADESEKIFIKRVHDFLDEVCRSNKFQNNSCIYLCSHGDVLPVMIDSLSGQWYQIKKGKWLLFAKKGSKWIQG